MPHLVQSITHTADRHDLEPVENLGLLGVLEYIRAGHKHFLPMVYTQYGHGITERVGMVGCKDDSAVGRYMLLADVLKSPIRATEHPIDVRTQKSV